MKKGKLTKKEIEKRWLKKVKNEYQHMSRMERMKLLFDFGLTK